MYNFTYPKKSKSGTSVKELWISIKEARMQFNKASLDDDRPLMEQSAARFKKLIDDLGIKGYEPLIIDLHR